MRSSDIITASAALGSQLAAGISVQDALGRMPQLQRHLEHVWEPIADAVRDGSPLSRELRGVWPDDIVSAVCAAELSGTLPEVFRCIEDTFTMQRRISALAGQVVLPLMIILGAIAAFIFYMIKVIPGIARIARPGSLDDNTVFRLSTLIIDIYENHWFMALLVVGGAIIAVGYLLSLGSVRTLIQKQLDRIPLLGDAMRQLAFGLWANYLAIVDSAGGIDMPTKLRLTLPVLPGAYRKGVHLVANEVVQRGLRDAVEPAKQPKRDPRRKWPFYITVAFLLAAEHGDLAKELNRAAPPMLEDGFKKAQRVFIIVNIAAMILAATMIAIPVVTMYTTISSVIGGNML